VDVRAAVISPTASASVLDDAFFSPDGKDIIARRDYSVISVIDITRHKIVPAGTRRKGSGTTTRSPR
jgi:hypothetical protein